MNDSLIFRPLFLALVILHLFACQDQQDSGISFLRISDQLLVDVSPFVEECSLDVEHLETEIPNELSQASSHLLELSGSEKRITAYSNQSRCTELINWLNNTPRDEPAYSVGVGMLYRLLKAQQALLETEDIDRDTLTGYLYFHGLYIDKLLVELPKVSMNGEICLPQDSRDQVLSLRNEYRSQIISRGGRVGRELFAQ